MCGTQDYAGFYLFVLLKILKYLKTAPEVLMNTGDYGPEVDIWSLGVMIFSMFIISYYFVFNLSLSLFFLQANWSDAI